LIKRDRAIRGFTLLLLPKSKRKEQRLKKQINKNYWWENIHQYAGKKPSVEKEKAFFSACD